MSSDLTAPAKQFTMEHVLSSIHYYRCHSYMQLLAIVNTLPDFVAKHNKVTAIDREREREREGGRESTL